jgi:hypothetical protein
MQDVDEAIGQRRITYACCAMSYMGKYINGLKYGGELCSSNRNLWLYMLWAKTIAERVPTSTEGDGGCVDLSFAQQVFAKADCYCDQCGCPPQDESSDFPPTDPCDPQVDYTVIRAVDVSERVAIEAAGPTIGDKYIVVTDTGGTGWVVNTIVEWNGSGWDQTTIAIGQNTLASNTGDLWTTPVVGLPGLLYPTVTMTFFAAPGQYIFQSDYPQVSQYAGRTAMVEILTPGGWVMLFQGPEADLASPQVYDLSGFSFTSVRATYTLGDCSWTSENGSIEPPGCTFPRDHDCNDHDTSDHS